MAIEIQPVEYDAASLNRTLDDIEQQLAQLRGLTYEVSTQDSTNITVDYSGGTITFTVTTFDGSTKSGTVAIA